MKFVTSWVSRSGGSGIDNEAAVKRGLELFSRWSPPGGLTFHQFVGRLDGEGGFAVVETDDPEALMDAPAKFAPFFEFTIHPVADIQDVAGAGGEAVTWRASG
jgi:hypothetical protein